MLLITAVLYVLSLANASSVPFITACKWSDTTCATASSDRGILALAGGQPSYNVPPMEPLHLEKIDASTSNLKFVVSDVTVVGLKDCKTMKLERDELTTKIDLTLECSITLDGQYELDGNFSILNVHGNGKIHAALYKALYHLVLDVVTKTGADGEDHWHITKFHHTFEIPNKSDLSFENLKAHNGDLNPVINKLMEENGSEVAKEIGGPVITRVITTVVKYINKFFGSVPSKYFTTN